MESLKKGFLPPVSLHSKGVDRTIRPTFPKQQPSEMVSGKRLSRKRSGFFKKQNTLKGIKFPSPPSSFQQRTFSGEFADLLLSH